MVFSAACALSAAAAHTSRRLSIVLSSRSSAYRKLQAPEKLTVSATMMVGPGPDALPPEYNTLPVGKYRSPLNWALPFSSRVFGKLDFTVRSPKNSTPASGPNVDAEKVTWAASMETGPYGCPLLVI